MRLTDLLLLAKARIAGLRVFATGGGPPDLEELWRDLNRKLSGIFGSRRGPTPVGGGSGGGGPPNMKAFGGGVALVAVVVVFLWASSGFFIVPEGQTAAIMRFGKFIEQTSQAGFKWRLPYPVEQHEMGGGGRESREHDISSQRGGEARVGDPADH